MATHTDLPLTKFIHQGVMVQRPSALNLHVDTQQRIFVSGRVLELGRGVISL
jgi:predicted PhzF superfamily epimerase YddE/YHI9